MASFRIMFVHTDCSHLNVFLPHAYVGHFTIKECFGYNTRYFKNYACINTHA